MTDSSAQTRRDQRAGRTTSPVRAGSVFGFGLGGLADGIVLHQVLQWHHFLADDVTTATVDGLEKNTLADGIFHVAVLVVVVVGTWMLWRAAANPGSGWGRKAVGAVLLGWGIFNLVDALTFHLVLDLHHIRMVDDYLVYDLAFAALGLVLVGVGAALLRTPRNAAPS